MHLYRDETGSGPSVVLVHGSIGPGWAGWAGQAALAARWHLIVPHRSGYPPNPPLDRIEPAVQGAETADLLGAGAHLVGHSYGALVAMFAAAHRPAAVRSLTLIEPPAFGVARDHPAVVALTDDLRRAFELGRGDPRAYLAGFLEALGSTEELPPALPPDLEAGVRSFMVERHPWDVDPPLDALREAGFPVLAVSGGWHPAFEATTAAIVERTGAELVTITGMGHEPQAVDGFNEILEGFLVRAEG